MDKLFRDEPISPYRQRMIESIGGIVSDVINDAMDDVEFYIGDFIDERKNEHIVFDKRDLSLLLSFALYQRENLEDLAALKRMGYGTLKPEGN